MPFFEITDEQLKTLDDSVKSQLKTYTPEDTTGLKEKANKLLSEKKSLEAEKLQLQADLKKAGSGTGDDPKTKSLLEDSERRRSELETQMTELKQSITKRTIDSEALSIAASLTKDQQRQKLLAKEVAQRLQYEDDNFVVTDAKGNHTISTIDELKGEFKTQYPFLVDGSSATGGGASGDGGRAAGSQKTMSRSDFGKLQPSEKMQFSKDGGTLTQE